MRSRTSEVIHPEQRQGRQQADLPGAVHLGIFFVLARKPYGQENDN
jgi:hypothetical protein